MFSYYVIMLSYSLIIITCTYYSVQLSLVYKIKLSDNNWWGLAPTVIGIGGAIAPSPPLFRHHCTLCNICCMQHSLLRIQWSMQHVV